MAAANEEPIGLGIIGLGRWARVLANAIGRSPRLRLAGATSRSEEKRSAFCTEFACPAFPDVDSLLRAPDVEAVLVTVPNDQHATVVEQVAASGKAVYVEKPIANTLEDALRIVEASRRHGVVLSVGHSARLLAGVRAIHDAIARGDLGPVVLMEANFSNDRALELNPSKWRFYRASTPGGPLSQLAIHHFDTLEALGGRIEEVTAMGARLQTQAEVDDVAVTLARFADGKLAYTGSAWASPGVYRLTVVGTEALMHYQLDFQWWDRADALHDHSELYLQGRRQGYGERIALPVPAGDMFREEIEDFALAARDGRRPLLTGEAAVRSLAVVHAAIEAEESGRSVRVADVLARAAKAVEA
jgi:predicted dehydrogenase